MAEDRRWASPAVVDVPVTTKSSESAGRATEVPASTPLTGRPSLVATGPAMASVLASPWYLTRRVTSLSRRPSSPAVAIPYGSSMAITVRLVKRGAVADELACQPPTPATMASRTPIKRARRGALRNAGPSPVCGWSLPRPLPDTGSCGALTMPSPGTGASTWTGPVTWSTSASYVAVPAFSGPPSRTLGERRSGTPLAIGPDQHVFAVRRLRERPQPGGPREELAANWLRRHLVMRRSPRCLAQPRGVAAPSARVPVATRFPGQRASQGGQCEQRIEPRSEEHT